MSLALFGTALSGYPFLGSAMEFSRVCGILDVYGTGSEISNKWLPFLSPEGLGDFVFARCSGYVSISTFGFPNSFASAEMPLSLAILPSLWLILVQYLSNKNRERPIPTRVTPEGEKGVRAWE